MFTKIYKLIVVKKSMQSLKEQLKFNNFPLWGKIIIVGLVAFCSFLLMLISVFTFYFFVELSGGDNLDEELQELREMKDELKCVDSCLDELDSYDYYYLIETKLCSCFDINDNLIKQLVID